MEPKDIKDAVQFSNFAQRTKTRIWNRGHQIKENDLDDILLVAWEEIKKLENK